jgi:hypothetical protein
MKSCALVISDTRMKQPALVFSLDGILRRDWQMINFIDLIHTLGSPRVIWRSSETFCTAAGAMGTICRSGRAVITRSECVLGEI